MSGFNFWWEWFSEEVDEGLYLSKDNMEKCFERAFKAGEEFAMREMVLSLPLWQAMDTAPKNGRHILVLEDDGWYNVAHWDKSRGAWVCPEHNFKRHPVMWVSLPLEAVWTNYGEDENVTM